MPRTLEPQTPHRSRSVRVRRPTDLLAAVCAVLVSLLAGCASGPATDARRAPTTGDAGPQVTSSTPASSTPGSSGPVTPLLRWSSTGGMCGDGHECHSEVVLRRDGSWSATTEPRSGVLPTELLAQVRAVVDTQAGQLLDLPRRPTRSCASWADGSDLEISAYGPAGPVTVSSCDVTIDEDNVIVAVWHQVVAAIG